jgi:hypothetical protein
MKNPKVPKLGEAAPDEVGERIQHFLDGKPIDSEEVALGALINAL